MPLALWQRVSPSRTVGQFADVEIKARLGPAPPRGVFFSSCRAAHQQLSPMAQSYPQVQRFLAEGSDRALGKLCYFDHWRSRL
jgi:hypothetical protein